MPRAMSPYTGATGPSHPYGMYPQVGVSRSPSAGSTSTIRPQERPLGEMNGPQHPYAMYSQNVVEEGIDDDMVPVGFPGHNPPYQPPADRRDDELGDIIGPDGHAEPLPPYSRYPTGVVPKPPGAEDMTDNNPLPEDSHLHSLSREAPISETSTRPLMPVSSGHGNGSGSGNAENGDGNNGNERRDGTRAPLTGIMAFEEKLRQKGKRTACCGLPVWTFVLIITVLLIGGSIGGVIGGVLGTKRAAEAEREAQQHQSHGPYIVTVTQTPQMDYSTMTSTPTNLRTLPTGHYLIPSVMRNCSRMCIDGSSEMSKAWSCMDKPNDFEVYVEGSGHEHSIVFVEDGPTSTFTYGPQPPYLPTPTQSLTMAIDNSDPSMGPALFFYSFFNKLVILPDNTFTSSSVSKRSHVNRDDNSIISSLLDRKETAQPGDKPWFCWWNNTMLEFFLYVNQSSTDTSSGSTATTDSDMAASTATGPSSSNSKRSADAADYPRKIKIEERRDHSGATAPYCQQMQVMNDGQVVPLANQIIDVKEREPTPTTTYTNSNAGSQQTYTAQASYVTPCYCLSLTD